MSVLPEPDHVVDLCLGYAADAGRHTTHSLRPNVHSTVTCGVRTALFMLEHDSSDYSVVGPHTQAAEVAMSFQPRLRDLERELVVRIMSLGGGLSLLFRLVVCSGTYCWVCFLPLIAFAFLTTAGWRRQAFSRVSLYG